MHIVQRMHNKLAICVALSFLMTVELFKAQLNVAAWSGAWALVTRTQGMDVGSRLSLLVVLCK
jgi:hypothetical protein